MNINCQSDCHAGACPSHQDAKMLKANAAILGAPSISNMVIECRRRRDTHPGTHMWNGTLRPV